MSVAESTVIFAPIDQLGCRSASAAVIPSSSLAVLPRNGPPDAVRMIFLSAARSLPCSDWKIALCSLSTGSRSTPFSSAASITSRPPATSVSLLASATVFLAAMAASVGRRPTIPTTALHTTSTPGSEAASHIPSTPASKRISVSARRVFRSA